MTKEKLVNKLPEITLIFWIMKICATTLGETAGDLLSMTLNIGYAASSLILISIFFLTFFAQVKSKKYHPFLYWSVIVSTSTAGTTMSDYIDRSLGLGYVRGSIILITILVATLLVWRKSAGSLSVTNIRTVKAELFYWGAILFSNTLGTAFGDFLADSSGLGFAGGALLVSGLLALIIFINFYTEISKIFLFWAAFILTRPFGATMGDLLTKPPEKGGLDFGTIGSSIILGGILVLLIVLTSANNHKQKRKITIKDRISKAFLCGSAISGCLALYLVGMLALGNFHATIPGELYRSAQPEPGDIRTYAEKYHIKSVLNLRGEHKGIGWYDDEVKESLSSNVTHLDFRMSSKKQLTKEQALALIEVMKNMPKPLLIHCRSGADRTGLASALYVAGIKKGSEFDSELQLSLRYGHLPFWFTSAYAMNRTFEALEPYLGFGDS